MSGFQALVVGVAGLQAQTNSLGIISDNIANVNTVGYKKSSSLFKSLVASDVTVNYAPGGVVNGARHVNHAQGLISNTASPTDLAIAGTGYFAVRAGNATTGDLFYTRAGSFLSDVNGDFKNSAGFFLQGWLLDDEQLDPALSVSSVDAATGIAALVPVNVLGLTLAASPTTDVAVHANLTASETIYAGPPAYSASSSAANMADGVVPPAFSRDFQVIDSLGTEHTLTVGFIKTGINAWSVEVYASSAAEIGAASAQIAAGDVTFNGDGSLATIGASLTSALSISWATPAVATNALTVDWGTAGIIGVGDKLGLGQMDMRYISTVTSNGYLAGSLSSLNVTDEGFVVAIFNNGVSQKLYKIPLANFIEQDELASLSGNIFTQTMESGDVSFIHAGLGLLGRIFGSALENSNVDVASQLTDMIIAQRSYQANTKIVISADDMLKEVTRMLG